MVGGLLAFAAASLFFVVGGEPHLLGTARLAQVAAAAAFSPAAGAAIAAFGRTTRMMGRCHVALSDENSCRVDRRQKACSTDVQRIRVDTFKVG
jgi:hypothetical protein